MNPCGLSSAILCRAHGIAAAKLAQTPEKWVVMVRPSLIRDYAPNGIAPNGDDAWCWSMWRGYLDNDDGKLVRKWFEDGGSRAAQIHTSGHASPVDLRSFAHAMNARQPVPIHGVAWDGDTTDFYSIRRVADGGLSTRDKSLQFRLDLEPS
jgi:ribonuclease J